MDYIQFSLCCMDVFTMKDMRFSACIYDCPYIVVSKIAGLLFNFCIAVID